MFLFTSSLFFGLPRRVVLSFALFVSFSAVTSAQTPQPTQTPVEEVTSTAETVTEPAQPADALQTRIGRSRALIAAHRLDIAASELESIRAAAKDNSVRNIASIMLMSVYLEEGNYGRAEALLEETFQARLAQKDESLGTYFALSGQAINGARTHLARYRTFGISTTTQNLPAEAQADLTRLRSLLERMIAQAKDIANDRPGYDSLSLLEDVLGIRLSLATDAEDQAKWSSEYVSARESLASAQTQIAALGGVPPLRPGKGPVNNSAAPSPYSTKKPAENVPDVVVRTKSDAHAERNLQPAAAAPINSQSSSPDPKAAEAAESEAGSLNAFATKKVVPRYPVIAKTSGASGMVRVHVIVEGGKVISVSKSEGPMLLRQAAEDAAKQWLFQSISVEGRPARLSGYIDFNFTL